MSDHPVLIPTRAGPVGATVTDPDAGRRAAVVLLHGAARGGRAGMDAVWTRIARSLAELEVTTLRLDYSNDGDSSMIGIGGIESGAKIQRDRTILREAVAWFRDRLGERQLILVGSCYGGRLAAELAQEDPELDAMLLVVPYLGRGDNRRPGWLGRLPRVRRALWTSAWSVRLRYPEPFDPDILDPDLVEAFRSPDVRTPTWMLVGDRDPQSPPILERLLGEAAAELEVEVVPGERLYPVYAPDIREQVTDRLLARVATTLDGQLPGAPR